MDSTHRFFGNRVLMSAFAVSIGVHVAAFAVRFVDPELFQLRSAETSLEVVLVNAKSDTRPSSPQALAQVNLDGGGSNEQGRRSSPLPNSFQVSDGDTLESARRTVERLEREQRQLLAMYKTAADAASANLRGDSTTATAVAESKQARQQLARMQAEISKEISDYQKRPRVQRFMPSTSEYRFARYVEDWRARIEKVGNDHYPDDARGRIYGALRMTVVIGKDGSLIDSIIEQSSGSPVLDRAARRIVKLAAPFPAFPPDMAKDTDEFEITRTWMFTNDQFATRASSGVSAQ
jgi:protein TonB